jgi:hypothetical protein
MKALVLVAVVGCVFASREATAQGFFYGAPEYSDFYGANLGNGVGFGYGIGITLPPNVLNSSVTDTYVPPFQELCDSNPSFILRGQATAPQTQVLPIPAKKKAPLAKKKSVTKVTLPKSKPVKKSAVP